MLIGFMTQAGMAAFVQFGTAYLDRGLNMPTEMIGTVASLGQVGAMLAALAAPRLSRRMRPGRDVLLASWFDVLSLVPAILVAQWAPAIATYVLSLAINSLWAAAHSGWMMDAVEEDHRAATSGLCNMAKGAGTALASLGGGFVIATVGYRALFGLGAVTIVMGALALTVLLGSPPRSMPPLDGNASKT